jgi:peptidyl-prolyl cis-trans isomerase C
MTRIPFIKVLMMVLLLIFLSACKPGQETPAAPKTETQAGAAGTDQAQTAAAVASAVPANLVIDVDGHRMTREQLQTELDKRLQVMKDQIPKERLQEVKETVRKRLMDDFVIRSLLQDEVGRRKIMVSEKEVMDALEQMRGSMPQGVTIEDLMRRNQVTQAEMKEEIRFGIQINKLVLASLERKTKPTDKEITSFYRKNKDKFKLPESVRVRHILVAKSTGDDEKMKAEKKAKAEGIRNQLLGGADFAQLAMTSSDCPSKQAGGDLGTFTAGQMVKPFEDAAFSQKKGEIGPVVETDFGYHILQVLEKNNATTMNLDNEIKDKIAVFLAKQKQQEAFDRLMKNLREKAKIVYYGS